MADYLFLFSISPVQSFISQARKTKDLYAGSKLLSKLIKLQIDELSKQDNTKLIFPDINSDSIPNRFVAKISGKTEKEIEELGKHLQNNFNDSFVVLAKKSYTLIAEDFHIDQVKELFSTNWVAVPIETDYKTAYLKLEKLHAATKNIKTFKQLNNGKGEQGRKCSLCGERNALFYNANKKPSFIEHRAIAISSNELTSNESLCAVCALKRFFPNIPFPSTAEIALKETIPQNEMDLFKSLDVDAQLFYDDNLNIDYLKKDQIDKPLKELRKLQKQILIRCNLKSSDLPKYYALIMFDGDNMGKLLSGENLNKNINMEEFHKTLAKALSENAKKAKEILDKVGKTVYAGGDDFLGFCSLKALLPTLKLLNDTFKKEVNDKLTNFVNKKITMSAGIAIAHYKMPLSIILTWARKMEKEAKNKGRDSFAFAILKHSGEIHKSIRKWNNANNSNIENMQKIIDLLILKQFSTNFIYTLEEEFLKLSYDKNKTYDKQFATELKRLIHKSNIANIANGEKELYDLCYDFFIDSEKNIDDYFTLMRIISFVARQLGGEK